MQQRKVNQSFTIELSQLERLGALSQRTRIPMSEIVRNALERELAKREQQQEQVAAVSNGRRVAVDGAGRRKKTSRRV